MRKLIALLSILLLLPSLAFAATAAPWQITNLSDTFIFPTLVNGASKGIILSASSTIFSFSSTNATATNATSTKISATLASTTNLTISGLGNSATNCLQVSAQGVVSASGSGCGVSSYDAWTHPGAGISATSSQVIISASSTIGNGTGTGGLTINGNSTTTGDVYLTGQSVGGLAVTALGRVYSAATSTLSTISGTLALTQLATQAANTVVANGTGGTAAPTAIATSSFFGIGTNGRILAEVSGVPTWVATTTAGTGLAYDGTSFNFASIAAGTAWANGTGATAVPTAIATSSWFGVGTNGTVLAEVGGIPTWVATTTLSTITGTLPTSKGGTGLVNPGGLSAGAILNYNGSGGASAISAGAAGTVITSNGSDWASGTLNLSSANSLSGDLPFANLTQGAANTVLANVTGATADYAALATSSIYTGSNGQTLARVGGAWIGVATTTAGTGLSYNGSSFTVNTSQNIATLSNLTTNGIMYTAGSNGTLTVVASSTLFGVCTGGQVWGYSNATSGWTCVSTSTTQSVGLSVYDAWTHPGAGISATTSQIIISASSTIGNGALGLTINGNATTTGLSYFANNVGIGTTSAQSLLQLYGSFPRINLTDSGAGANLKNWHFTALHDGSLVIGTTTDAFATSTTAFRILNQGMVSFGTSTPYLQSAGVEVSGTIFSEEIATTTVTQAAPTFDWSKTTQYIFTMRTNVTSITFTNGKPGMGVRLILCQDTTGSRTVAGWDANILWAGGTAPTQTATLNKCDVYPFTITGGTTTLRYFGGGPAQNF